MNIVRGDNKKFKIIRKTQNSEIIDEIVDKMYFTVKKNCYVTDYLFQKTLENGITYDDTNKCYVVEIKPEDTNNLSFINYSFDIEIIKDGKTKTLLVDTFSVEPEITYKENEG